MKRIYLVAALSLTLMTANAQEPNIPRGMFGGQQIDVKFDAYKAAPDGLMNNSAQLKAFCDEKGIPCTLINYPEQGHNFIVWKYGLYNFAQLIFK